MSERDRRGPAGENSPEHLEVLEPDTTSSHDPVAAATGVEPSSRFRLGNRMLVVILAASVALVAFGLAVMSRPQGAERQIATRDSTVETSLPPGDEPADALTTPTSTEDSAPLPTSTTTTIRARRTTATTTAAPAAAPQCRNSEDPVCGPFRWDPAPAPNQGLTARFIDPPSTWDGQSNLEVQVEFSDPDSYYIWSQSKIDEQPRTRDCSWVKPRYGPWTPPPIRPTGGTFTAYLHFEAQGPGTHIISLALATGTCGDPYVSDAVISFTVEVPEETSGGDPAP